MSNINILAVALAATAMLLPAHAADNRYPADFVKKIEIIEPSAGDEWEDKNFLDCDDVLLTEEDVRYALRHMRRISKEAYYREDESQPGCSGGASVTFKSGKTIVIDVEPSGRVYTFEANKKLDPIPDTISFYACAPCKVRKMALLKDALSHATERRLKMLRESR